jgi:tetratricopeptide (TPR) repeat protein
VADSPRIEDLRRRIQEDPASLAFAPLAEELRRAGRAQEAIRVCRTGLALHPEYLSARATLGRALLDLGQLDEALAELTAVLAAAPEHLSAIRGIAEIHRLRGEPRVTQPSGDAPPPVAEPDSPDRAAVVARLEQFLAAIVADRQRRRSVPRR